MDSARDTRYSCLDALVSRELVPVDGDVMRPCDSLLSSSTEDLWSDVSLDELSDDLLNGDDNDDMETAAADYGQRRRDGSPPQPLTSTTTTTTTTKTKAVKTKTTRSVVRRNERERNRVKQVNDSVIGLYTRVLQSSGGIYSDSTVYQTNTFIDLNYYSIKCKKQIKS